MANHLPIPKVIHIIWIGDETKRPDNCISTWIKMNPTWKVQVWGNEELATYGWINGEHMKAMAEKELCGVADMMRYEILYNEGGFAVDADSVCVRSLEDWMLECEAFACYENELVRSSLIAVGYLASVKENPFIGQIILDIKAEPSVVHDMAWKTVGPIRLTTTYLNLKYANLTVFPSHFFIPKHFSGAEYTGSGPIFAKQLWGSTVGSYDTLHLELVA